MALRSAEHYRRPGDNARASELAARKPGLWTAATDVREALAAGEAPKSAAVRAVVNQGRWVVECPDCGSAQLASLDDRRFMCVECANVSVAGLWRPIIVPRDSSQIARLLAQRPEKNRNWLPGESLSALREENARAFGLGD